MRCDSHRHKAVSRLRGRLSRLEQAAARQGCPGCAEQPAVIDLLGPDSTPRNERELTPCAACSRAHPTRPNHPQSYRRLP